jgi:hypothetical protein
MVAAAKGGNSRPAATLVRLETQEIRNILQRPPTACGRWGAMPARSARTCSARIAEAVEAGHRDGYICPEIDGDGVPPKLLERADDSYRFVTAVGRLFGPAQRQVFFVLAGHRRGDP